jgi:hypothetical protein
MPIDLISNIQPAPGGAGLFPTHLDIYGAGGYQVRATTASRDSIPPLNRKEGMVVYVVADTTEYRLNADLLTWTAVPSGGGGTLAGDVTGPSSANTVVNLTGAAGVVTVPTAALAFGTNPSTAAGTLLRIPYGVVFLSARSQAGTGNIALGTWTSPGNSLILGNSTTDSTQLVSGTDNVILTGAGGRVDFLAGGIRNANNLYYWSSGVTAPAIAQDPQVSNTVPAVMTVTTQQPFNNVATTGLNNVPGSLRFDVGTPTNGATVYPNIFMRWSGTDRFTFGWSASGGPFISYGAIGALQPAASGLLRFPHIDIPFLITMRNAANLADLRIVSTNAADLLIFGDSAAASSTIIQSGQGVLIQSGGVTRALFQATTADHADFGPLPATTGFLRVSAATSTATVALASRDTTNATDISLATVDTGNNAVFGGYGGSNTITAARSILTATALVAFNPRNTSSLSGALAVDAYTLNWGELATGPILGQTTRTTDALPQNYTIRPQQPNPGAGSTGNNRIPGSIILDLGTPGGSPAGTTWGQILFPASGSTQGSIQYLGASQFRLYGGAGGATDPYLQLSSAGNGSFILKAGGPSNNVIDYGSGGNLFIQSGGTTHLQITGGALYSHTGQFIVVEAPSSGQWSFVQSPRTTNLTPLNFTITPQQPFSGGTPTAASGKPGDLILTIGAPVSPATAYGRFVAKTTGNVTQWTMQTVLEGSATNGLTLIGGASTGTDAFLQLYSGAGWFLSGPAAGAVGTINAASQLSFQIAGVTKTSITTSAVNLTGTGITQTTLAALVTASSGSDWTFQHANRSSDIPATTLTIKGTAASTSPPTTGANADGGRIIIQGGRKNNDGVNAGRLRGVTMSLGDQAAGPLFELTELQASLTAAGTGTRMIALLRNGFMTTTEMPTGSGDLVIFIGNAASVPTANPASGSVLYVDPADGATKIRGRSGTVTTIAPA